VHEDAEVRAVDAERPAPWALDRLDQVGVWKPYARTLPLHPHKNTVLSGVPAQQAGRGEKVAMLWGLDMALVGTVLASQGPGMCQYDEQQLWSLGVMWDC
jgi:hypothetical protein